VAPFTPLPVEPVFTNFCGNQVAHYRAGSGEPLLLLHSINAAASAYEMRGPFNGLHDSFTVHAIDLLGYGRSDRPARLYRPDDYIKQIGHTLQQFDTPVNVVASSLTAAFMVHAAIRWPEHVKSLILVCPTGIQLLNRSPTLLDWATYRVLSGPVGDIVFENLTTRDATRYFLLQEAYAKRATVTSEVVESFYLVSHQPGAKYAPICFVTSMLNCDISELFGKLTPPVLLIWGRQSKTAPLRQADAFLERNPRATLQVLDGCSMLAQDERPDDFNALVRAFLA
jgi:pimeloyl-ACP methyl ester carboxylesterase